MISELTDEEILDFLMTSDFNDDFKPSEFKYLLQKWRYFYRIIHSRKGLLKSDLDLKNQQMESDKKDFQNSLDELRSIIVKKDELIESMKNRKLTLKERFSGKIITNDED